MTLNGKMETSTFQPIDSPDDNSARNQNIFLGCLLSICGNLLISVSLNVQKYTHVRSAANQCSVHYTRQPLWWLGLSLMVLGEVGNFSAFGFAPASLVAPLGTTTVIANTFIAVLFLKEKLRPADLFGCTLCIVGAFLLVSFSNKGEKVLDATEIISLLEEVSFIVYASLQIVGLVILFVLRYKFKIENVVQILLICAFLASFTVISAKGVSGMLQLTMAGNMQMKYAVFWVLLFVMAATAIAQVKYLNQAMKSFNATTVVPTHFVFFTISAITAGVVFYKEFYGLAPVDVFMFIFGRQYNMYHDFIHSCLLCFVGVYFITAGRAAVLPQVALANKTGDCHLDDDLTEPILPTATTEHARQRVNIFPSWLYTTVNRAEVQPHMPGSLAGTHIDHVNVSSRRPSSSSSSSEYSPEHVVKPYVVGGRR